MPRLLIHLATPGGMTGAPKRTLYLCESLRSRGVVVGVAGDPSDEFFADAARRGFETLPLPRPALLSRRNKALLRGWPWIQIRTALSLFRMNARLVKMIRSWKADVLWTRGAKGLAFIAPASVVTRRPLVWDVAMTSGSGVIVKLLHRIGLAVSAAVVVQYPAAARRIFGPAAAAKYARRFHPLIPAIELEPLRRWSTANPPGAGSPFVLLQAGTVSERKNQMFAVECLAALRQSGNDAELWIAGGMDDRAYADRLHALAGRLDVAAHVKMLGWRDDVHGLMTRSDVFILPSLDEGVSNAVQEAMFLGLPVVVSDAGGLPEIIENGVTGWSLPLDRDAWARVLGSLAESAETRGRIGGAAARHAAAAFGENAWADAYAALIRHVARPCHRIG